MNIFQQTIKQAVLLIGKIHWPTSTMLSLQTQAKIHQMLAGNYFVILTYRKNHLSSFFVCLANWLLTGRWGQWTHALMNLEDKVDSIDDFRLIEATGVGTHFTPFEQVFDCHGVALLKPKSMTLDEWTGLLDRAKTELGKPYDTLFDLTSDKSLSCVELVRVVLQGEPNYAEDFKNFEALIAKRKNLTPQMYMDCGDFEVVFIDRI